MQKAAGREPERKLVHEWRLQQAALVVPLLRPGIGKKDVDAREGLHRNHLRNDLGRIVLDDAHVGDPALVDQLEQAAYARSVHLHGKEVVLGHRLRDGGCRLAHAEADLQDPRGLAAEDEIEIERRRREGNAETRQQRFARALLRRRESALAQHEAPYGSAERTRARFVHCTRFQLGSLNFRSTVAAAVAPSTLYSIASVSGSFHLAVASAQPLAFHTSSLRRLSGVIRQMAISLLHCV